MPTCRRPAVQHSEQHKKCRACTPIGEASAGTACDEGAGVGYLHIMCLIGFFCRACLHKRW